MIKSMQMNSKTLYAARRVVTPYNWRHCLRFRYAKVGFTLFVVGKPSKLDPQSPILWDCGSEAAMTKTEGSHTILS